MRGVLDDARAGEADHGFRLGEDEIAQTGVAGHDACGGRIGEYADVGEAGFGVVGQRRRSSPFA